MHRIFAAGRDRTWPSSEVVGPCLLAILVGSGAYGATLGLWRSGLQGVYVAIKFPLLILLTTGGTGLMNWLLATGLGLRVSFLDSVRTTLLSFAMASLVLGSLSPVTLFLLLNAPPLGSAVTNEAYALLMLVHVSIIAFAGVATNIRLYRLLTSHAPGTGIAARVAVTWLAANLFLGSQLSWNFRPFIGSPHLPVEFLRPNALEGNFYEAVFRSMKQVRPHSKGARHE